MKHSRLITQVSILILILLVSSISKIQVSIGALGLLYAILIIMFIVLIEKTKSFRLYLIKNKDYEKKFERSLKDARNIFTKYFLVSIIFYFLEGLTLAIGIVTFSGSVIIDDIVHTYYVDFNVSLFSVLILIYILIYFIVNYIALRKFKTDLDEILDDDDDE